MNLLDQFVLQHLQFMQLHAELKPAPKGHTPSKARVELKMSPRVLEGDDAARLPGYRVGCRLGCRSGDAGHGDHVFDAVVRADAVYRQVQGDAMDLAEFTSHHAILSRQLYPLLAQELKRLLTGIGVTGVHLPFDLTPRVNTLEGPKTEVSESLH